MPSPIQFGTQRFTAATGNRPEGVPDHAAMIEGPLIQLDTKNLKKWGVTGKATNQIIAGLTGRPIRACMNADPHACDFASDNFANVGYVTSAKVMDGWVVTEAAITDKAAAQKIDDETWMPFGEGGWSVTGFPSDPEPDFETSGLMNGFAPDAIALIIGNGKPAYEGSGFKRVAAAITNHGDDDMTKEDGDSPKTYTQAELDAKVKEMLAKQKTDDAAELKKAADAEIAKQNEASIAELTKQKAAHDAAIKKLSADEKAAYEAKIADMTSKDDLEATLKAQAVQIKKDIADTQERTKLITEYKDIVQKSPVAGAPFMHEGTFSDELFNAEVETLGGMLTAAIAGIVDKTKMVAAAVPGTDFNSLEYPSTPPGSVTTEADLLADLDAMDGATGQVR